MFLTLFWVALFCTFSTHGNPLSANGTSSIGLLQIINMPGAQTPYSQVNSMDSTNSDYGFRAPGQSTYQNTITDSAVTDQFEQMQNASHLIYEYLEKNVTNQLAGLTNRVHATEGTIASIGEQIANLTTRMQDVLVDVEHGLEMMVLGYPKDCHDIYRNGYKASGLYSIRPSGYNRSLGVYCEMVGDQPWTVIMRRHDGSLNFERGWSEYMKGFGSPDGEFWLGLDYMHMLTNQHEYKLRVDMTEWGKTDEVYAEFTTFNIDSSYKLTVAGESESQTATKNRLTYNNGRSFSTSDVDNDRRSQSSCVQQEGGAWWHGGCSYVVLTDDFTGTCTAKTHCMRWDYGRPLSKAVMKIARKTEE